MDINPTIDMDTEIRDIALRFRTKNDNTDDLLNELANALGISVESIKVTMEGKMCDFCLDKNMDPARPGYKCSRCNLFYDKCDSCVSQHPEDYCHEPACRDYSV